MKKIHIVSHTHWDREWYRPFEHFRSKLTFVMDRLLTILEDDPNYQHFMLDGQTIPLDDYLEVKPENADKLEQFIQSGRISVGPWYIQPDEFAPDGESLIRNLQIGMKTAKKFGQPMLIGYLPDSFGHSSQMPQILQGFGIHSAVVMRGVPSHLIKSTEFTWSGLNGDQVLAVFLPHGYSNAMFMPEKLGKFKLRMSLLIQQLKKWVSTDNYLVMNGVDHQFPQAHIPDFIKRLNQSQKRNKYIHSNLQDYIEDVRQSRKDFPELHGELIHPVDHRVHTSIASTRIYQKQKNRRVEALLENYVEPISAMAWIYHADYPQALIEQTWKYLIQNQTHDGICGCCLDAVHQEIDQRYAKARTIGDTLRDNYSRALAKKISPDQLTLTIFNNAMVAGRQFVRATVYLKHEVFSLEGLDGQPIPYQVEKTEDVDVSQRNIWTLYAGTQQMSKKVDICFHLDFQANIGCRVLKINEKGRRAALESGLQVQGNQIENKFFKVEICPNGTINLYDKELSIQHTGLNLFEDCGDAGDTYNYSPPERDTVITSQESSASVEIVNRGEHQVTAKIHLELEVPVSLTANDFERSAEKTTLPITSCVTVYSDIKRIDFQTEIDNTARDHRLRALFPAITKSDVSYAETQFGIVKRLNAIDTDNWKKKGWKEKPLPIYSQQRFVDLSDGNRGFAVLNRGLPEYEIYDDTVIALTLVRSVGFMGKEDLLIRPGRSSGIPVETPDAQCQGKNMCEYALFPHAGNAYTYQITQSTAMYNAPALAVQNKIWRERVFNRDKILVALSSIKTITTQIQGQLDELELYDLSILTLKDHRLIISAFKKAVEDQALILRLYNPEIESVKAAQLSFGIPVEAGWLTDFNEQEIRKLEQINAQSFLLPEVKPQTALTFKFYIQS